MERVFTNLPFLCFLGILGIAYIANTHKAERNLRKMHALQKQMNELKWQYMEVKSEMIYGSMQSELAKKIEKMEEDESGNIPKIIKASES